MSELELFEARALARLHKVDPVRADMCARVWIERPTLACCIARRRAAYECVTIGVMFTGEK